MVMFYNVAAARNQLLTYGHVYTLRKHRKTGRDIAVTGTRYNYTILGDIWIEEVKPIKTSSELASYVPFSGMQDATQWFWMAKSFYNKATQLYLYDVKLLRRRVDY